MDFGVIDLLQYPLLIFCCIFQKMYVIIIVKMYARVIVWYMKWQEWHV